MVKLTPHCVQYPARLKDSKVGLKSYSTSALLPRMQHQLHPAAFPYLIV